MFHIMVSCLNYIKYDWGTPIPYVRVDSKKLKTFNNWYWIDNFFPSFVLPCTIAKDFFSSDSLESTLICINLKKKYLTKNSPYIAKMQFYACFTKYRVNLCLMYSGSGVLCDVCGVLKNSGIMNGMILGYHRQSKLLYYE